MCRRLSCMRPPSIVSAATAVMATSDTATYRTMAPRRERRRAMCMADSPRADGLAGLVRDRCFGRTGQVHRPAEHEQRGPRVADGEPDDVGLTLAAVAGH